MFRMAVINWSRQATHDSPATRISLQTNKSFIALSPWSLTSRDTAIFMRHVSTRGRWPQIKVRTNYRELAASIILWQSVLIALCLGVESFRIWRNLREWSRFNLPGLNEIFWEFDNKKLLQTNPHLFRFSTTSI
jgi:hypothetical protein